MRLLHTSDWHLGRTLHGVDLLEYQRAVLDFIVGIAVEQQVDAIVIAGDVYDRSVPNVEAVQLLDVTLARLVDIAPVLLIPGNHDSATRLGFASGLLRDGLHIVSNLDGLTRPLVLADDHGDVAIYGMQFLEPEAFRGPLSGDPDEPLPRSHEAVVAAAMNRVRAEFAQRSSSTRAVVVAHEFVTGGAGSDSERDLRVGGIDTVSAASFAGVHYVALGHLHGPQVPTSPDSKVRLQYSGSPLRYSFSEAEQSKSVAIVELGADGVDSVELIDVPQPRNMARLKGELAELLLNTANVDDWVSVVVTDQEYPEDLGTKLRSRFPYLLELQHRPPVAAGGVDVGSTPAERDPIDVMSDFVFHVTGAQATQVQRDLLTDVFEQALASDRGE